MERKKIKEESYIIAYHTQEERGKELDEPIDCYRDDAWLGIGSYYWVDLEFAHYWGHDSKTNTGHYCIYKSEVNEEGILNATFSEEEYLFFLRSIEKARKKLTISRKDVTLKNVHQFLSDEVWSSCNLKGIIFDDLPVNPKKGGRVYSDILPLYYKKRIQMVVFDKNNIKTFQPYLRYEKCIKI